MALDDDASRLIVADWRRWLRTEHTELGEFGHQPLGASVATLVLRSHQWLLKNGRLITAESPAAQLHDLRRDAKRLRYLLECFASLMPAQPQRQFVKRLKLLQDNLGQHQDAEVHVARSQRNCSAVVSTTVRCWQWAA
jgi:CHAD domain-containing protein